MTKKIRELLKDVRQKLDVYIALVLTITAALLALLERVPQRVLWFIVLGDLGWLIRSFLKRQRDDQPTNCCHAAERCNEVGIVDIWPTRGVISSILWNQFVDGAKIDVWLYGVSMYGFAHDQNFLELVEKGVRRGCFYKFLLLDENSQSKAYLCEDGVVAAKLHAATEEFRKLIDRIQNSSRAAIKGGIELKAFDDIPALSIVRADDEMLVTHYLHSIRGDRSPTLHLKNKPNGSFLDYTLQFGTVWPAAKLLARIGPERPANPKVTAPR